MAVDAGVAEGAAPAPVAEGAGVRDWAGPVVGLRSEGVVPVPNSFPAKVGFAGV